MRALLLVPESRAKRPLTLTVAGERRCGFVIGKTLLAVRAKEYERRITAHCRRRTVAPYGNTAVAVAWEAMRKGDVMIHKLEQRGLWSRRVQPVNLRLRLSPALISFTAGPSTACRIRRQNRKTNQPISVPPGAITRVLGGGASIPGAAARNAEKRPRGVGIGVAVSPCDCGTGYHAAEIPNVWWVAVTADVDAANHCSEGCTALSSATLRYQYVEGRVGAADSAIGRIVNNRDVDDGENQTAVGEAGSSNVADGYQENGVAGGDQENGVADEQAGVGVVSKCVTS
ncbi:hypothetical protein FN846DRAFT_893170 [Sphaerosporella brunnea]|uniref:Uncharacterized protein n=1 Tax=Sphaerosporella brunnea TaxID=1250544 RepID=A0A5J5EN00_9PEZI|nr:hypothetical protein FN846DRAFT_893170 [Sphaerosporella brunnea]